MQKFRNAITSSAPNTSFVHWLHYDIPHSKIKHNLRQKFATTTKMSYLTSYALYITYNFCYTGDYSDYMYGKY